MIFGIIRWVIGIILFVLLFCVLKRKKRKPIQEKNRIIISGIIAFLVITVLSFIPIENLFVHFKTPESAYHYFQAGTPMHTVYGENSAMVIADDRDTENLSIISKADKSDSWKISLGYNTEMAAQAFDGGCSAVVYHHKPTGDNYIFVYVRDSQVSINDDLGTTFVEIPDENALIKEYVAYLSDFDSDYIVTVNGTQLTFD